MTRYSAHPRAALIILAHLCIWALVTGTLLLLSSGMPGGRLAALLAVAVLGFAASHALVMDALRRPQ